MATIYYAPVAGSDASPDATNPATPVQTIAEAQSRATAGTHAQDSGDVIRCLESASPPIPQAIKAGITYEAADGGTVIDATGTDHGVSLYSNQTLRGPWEVTGATSHGIEGYSTGSANRSVYVEGAHVHDCGGDGIRAMTSGSVIERVRVTGNAGIGINCLEADCIISVALVTSNGGGVVISGANAVMEHVTLAGNGSDSPYSISVSSDAVVRNCISLDNPTSYGVGLDLDNVSHCWVYSSDRGSYHTIEDYYGGVTPPSSGTTDPQLTDPGSGDYTLTPGSPCIGAGTAGTATVDLAGETYASPPSMGAYEAGEQNPPVVAFTSAPSSDTSAYTVTGTVTDASAISALRYRLNGGAWEGLTPDTAFGFDVALVPGANEVEVEAVDEFGNVGSETLAVTMRYLISDVVAETTGRIRVTFNAPADPATIEGAAAWTVAPADGVLAATVVVTDAMSDADDTEAVVTVHPAMTPGATYVATCAGLTSSNGVAGE